MSIYVSLYTRYNDFSSPVSFSFFFSFLTINMLFSNKVIELMHSGDGGSGAGKIILFENFRRGKVWREKKNSGTKFYQYLKIILKNISVIIRVTR